MKASVGDTANKKQTITLSVAEKMSNNQHAKKRTKKKINLTLPNLRRFQHVYCVKKHAYESTSATSFLYFFLKSNDSKQEEMLR